MKTTLDGNYKLMVIDVCARLRCQLPKNADAAYGYTLAAIPVLASLECFMPDHERWTTIPATVAECRTLGDHLALCRIVLGLCA
jgi:hypothetical protein